MFDVVMVVSLFNMVNRFVDAHGLPMDDERARREGQMLAQYGYAAGAHQFNLK